MSGKQKAESQKPQEQAAPENPHLNPALEGKYRIKDTHCRYVLNTSIGDIDFATLTEEQAGQLVADGMPHIEKVFS